MSRWLTTQQQHAWRTYLEVMARHMEMLDDDLQKRSQLAMTDYEILVMLSEEPDNQLRMSELAEKVIVSRSRLTYRVDRLVARGLLERVDFAHDRRGVLARLTDEGMQLLVATAPGHVDLVRSLIFDGLTPEELTTFSGILDKMSDACNGNS